MTEVLKPEKETYGNEDINWVMETFTKVFDFPSQGTKKDRWYARHLLNNFSKPQIESLMRFCTTKYAPRVGSVEKLWFKRGDIIAGIKSNNSDVPKRIGL